MRSPVTAVADLVVPRPWNDVPRCVQSSWTVVSPQEVHAPTIHASSPALGSSAADTDATGCADDAHDATSNDTSDGNRKLLITKATYPSRRSGRQQQGVNEGANSDGERSEEVFRTQLFALAQLGIAQL